MVVVLGFWALLHRLLWSLYSIIVDAVVGSSVQRRRGKSSVLKLRTFGSIRKALPAYDLRPPLNAIENYNKRKRKKTDQIYDNSKYVAVDE